MRSQHRMRWHCFATSHEPSFFESPEILENHLRETHAGDFNSEEISFLVENSRHPSFSVIEHCPFCQQTADNTEEHVARHLIQFALRSLPWPDDCYSSYHPSQSSRSAHGETTTSSAEKSRDEDEILELRETDWNAWEKQIEAEDNVTKSLKSQQHDVPPLTGGKGDVVSLNDFIYPNYDAAEDEVLEPFRQRADSGAVKGRPAEAQHSSRQKCLRNFMKEEATFVRELHVLTEVYKGTWEVFWTEDISTKFSQTSKGRLFRNSDQLAALHAEFLKDLDEAVSSESKETQPPVSPDLIGTVFLENFRRLGPAHEVYSVTHEDAMSLLQRLQEE